MNSKQRYVIVTGSNGMVGSALQRVVTERNFNDLEFEKNYKWVWTTRKEMDLLKYDSVYKFLKNFTETNVTVINLAANVGGLFKNMNQNLEMFDSNISINLNLLRACKELGIKKVINILSTCIFPNDTKYPLIEEYINRGEPHNSNSGYSYAKRFGQIYSRIINESSEYYNYINFIPTNLYGKRDNYQIEDAHVIPAIIHKCIKKIKNRKESSDVLKLKLPGNGEPERMFLYDEDFAKIIIDFACNIKLENCKGDFIVSGDETFSVKIYELAKSIAEKVSRELNDKVSIEFENEEKGNGQLKKPCSNSKLISLYDNKQIQFPVVDNMSDNLDKVIEWFINNYDSYNRK